MASFLLKDVRIFDGEQTIEKGSVLVEHGQISKISSSAIECNGGTIYSKPGHTLLPGLIDTHIHADSGNELALPQSLRFGVTTVCDMHNEYPNIQKLRKQIEGGDCADLKSTSYAATIDMGWPMFVVLKNSTDPNIHEELATWPKLVTPEDGRRYVQDRLEENVNYIKLMHESGLAMGVELPKPSMELQKAIIDEAHKYGLVIVAHSTSLEDTIEILEAGVDGLTHTICDQPPNERLIAAYKRNNAHVNPTLNTLGSGTTEGQQLQEKYAYDPRIQHLIAEPQRQRMCMCMAFMQRNNNTVDHAYESVRQLKANGIDILCGSDAAGPALGTAWGLSAHQELFLFVEKCGFTPIEALRSATSLPAKRFNFSDRGRIQEGLRADMMLVEGNPLENIDDTLNLRGVWTAGRLCSAYKDSL